MRFACSRTCPRYGITVVAVAAAMFLRWATIPVLGLNTPYLTVYPVVVFVSVLLGIGPGIVAGLLGVWAVETSIVPPSGDVRAIGAALVRVGVILISAIYLGYVGQR